MSTDIIFLYIIAVIALLFAVVNCIVYILKHNKTAQTTGTIVSIKMPNSETARVRNSKWAIVTYMVSNKVYTSRNRVQVPMTAQVGSSTLVRYDVKQPDKLYSFSMTRIVVGVLISAVFFIVAVFNLI
nr:hypothetical protein NZ312_03320 [Clostridioides difficile]